MNIQDYEWLATDGPSARPLFCSVRPKIACSAGEVPLSSVAVTTTESLPAVRWKFVRVHILSVGTCRILKVRVEENQNAKVENCGVRSEDTNSPDYCGAEIARLFELRSGDGCVGSWLLPALCIVERPDQKAFCVQEC